MSGRPAWRKCWSIWGPEAGGRAGSGDWRSLPGPSPGNPAWKQQKGDPKGVAGAISCPFIGDLCRVFMLEPLQADEQGPFKGMAVDKC